LERCFAPTGFSLFWLIWLLKDRLRRDVAFVPPYISDRFPALVLSKLRFGCESVYAPIRPGRGAVIPKVSTHQDAKHEGRRTDRSHPVSNVIYLEKGCLTDSGVAQYLSNRGIPTASAHNCRPLVQDCAARHGQSPSLLLRPRWAILRHAISSRTTFAIRVRRIHTVPPQFGSNHAKNEQGASLS